MKDDYGRIFDIIESGNTKNESIEDLIVKSKQKEIEDLIDETIKKRNLTEESKDGEKELDCTIV